MTVPCGLEWNATGAGPTGVELAAELYDMVKEDVSKLYPEYLLDYVSIQISADKTFGVSVHSVLIVSLKIGNDEEYRL